MNEDIPMLINTKMKGKAKHLIVPLARTIGGLYNHTKVIASFDLPAREGLEKGILDIGILHSHNDEVRLRVWMDGISLVKEFYPNYSLKMKENVFSSILIDVLPLLKRDNSKIRSRVVIINTGSSPFFVSHASLFTFRGGGEEKKVIYASGGIPLSGGDEKEFLLDDGDYKYLALGGVYIAKDPPHSLEILLNKKVYRTLDIVKKAEDVEMVFSAPNISSLTIRRLKDLMGKKKEQTMITSLSLIATKEEEKEMELEAYVKRVGKDELIVECVVKNLTDRVMKRVSLIGFASGLVVNRVNLGDFPQGAEVAKTLEVKIPKDAKTFVLRLIWNDGGEAKFIEKRFKEKES
ncbi:MAG: hypothetical protein ACP5I2_03870 [Fervidicoccaceae archaeon]